MDQSVQRLLNDKLYDKRKQGALEYVKLNHVFCCSI
jgi:vacuole morphology and inheritance protein 14